MCLIAFNFAIFLFVYSTSLMKLPLPTDFGRLFQNFRSNTVAISHVWKFWVSRNFGAIICTRKKIHQICFGRKEMCNMKMAKCSSGSPPSPQTNCILTKNPYISYTGIPNLIQQMYYPSIYCAYHGAARKGHSETRLKS